MRHIHRLKLRNSHQYRDGWDHLNELEKDFNLGTVSVFQLHGFEQEELHRATGRALDIDEE